ncbi:uncharacterized protein LOC124156172 isoform X2 [Ischnura elegans]|uniref:uncharacterized protein LOC124156172 isoform X2 n=1 Tax=Ischnura elegans TaxID=197161 RepID=UPI001ED8AF1B|nr:uncharacterized protein LOC124156172 isoform X2 [Ischnura elegans]
MDFYRQRLLSIITICAYLFLGGVEFAVIFPTAWDYLQSLGVEEEYMLGITVSAYSLSGAFAGILGGYLADIYPQKTRLFSGLCSLVMVCGNLQYTVGYDPWNVVGSRLICGLGTAAGATLLAYICRVTTARERTAILSICNAARQVGVLVGPAFQALLTQVNLQIGPIMVNHTNAAGLLMAVLWVVGFLPLLVFVGKFEYTHHPLSDYDELPRDDDASKPYSGNTTLTMSSLFNHSAIKKDPIQITDFTPWSEENLKSKRYKTSHTEAEIGNHIGVENTKEPDTASLQDQTLIPVGGEGSEDSCSKSPAWDKDTNQSSTQLWSRRSSVASMATMMASIGTDAVFTPESPCEQQSKKSALLSDVVVSLLGTAFTLFFCQILIETIIPVYMKGYWDFGDVGTSMAYLIGGGQCLILFAALIPISKVVTDTVLQLVGLLLLLVGMGVLAIVLPMTEKGTHFWYFAGGCFTVGLAYPIASVANSSLLSKALSREVQGVGQGLRRFATYLGMILGPLWAGSSVRQPELLMGVSLVLIIIHLLMFLQTMKKLLMIERFLVVISCTNRSTDSISNAGRLEPQV